MANASNTTHGHKFIRRTEKYAFAALERARASHCLPSNFTGPGNWTAVTDPLALRRGHSVRECGSGRSTASPRKHGRDGGTRLDSSMPWP